METSVLGCLEKTSKVDVKRRKRIAYRKVKGRLSQKSSGVLNKSISWKNVHHKEESQLFNASQLVSVKNISSFLKKNRELAKALEESRCHSKSLEREVLVCRVEAVQMREEKSFYLEKLMGCTCLSRDTWPSTGDVRLLHGMKKILSSGVDLLNTYFSSTLSITSEPPHEKDASDFLKEMPRDSEAVHSDHLAPCRTKDAFDLLRGCLARKDAQVQCGQVADVRNKKLQVRLTAHLASKGVQCRLADSSFDFGCARCHYLRAAPGVDMDVTCEADIITRPNYQHAFAQTSLPTTRDCETQCASDQIKYKDANVQCCLVPPSFSAQKCRTSDAREWSTSTSERRQPLGELSLQELNKRPTSILKKKSLYNSQPPSLGRSFYDRGAAPIQIYEDSPSSKENLVSHAGMPIAKTNELALPQKCVRIFTPVKVHEFTPQKFVEDRKQERLRQGKGLIDYREPSLHCKLKRGNPIVDDQFYSSPCRRKVHGRRKKRRNRANTSIPLEELITSVAKEFRIAV